jgi:transposase
VDAGDAYRGEIPNAAGDIRKLLAVLRRKAAEGTVPHICFEPTGPYENALFTECARAGIPAGVLNPAQVRHHAKAMPESAKTDPVDARVIRLSAGARRPAPSRVPAPEERSLRQPVTLRDTLVENTVRPGGVLDSMTESGPGKTAARLIKANRREIKKLEERIVAAVNADAHTAGLSEALEGIDGTGALTAAKIIALAPEIGTLGRRGAASLAGLAPFNRDSGKHKGKAFVCGGRASVRRALYMPAVVAIRYNPVLKAFHGRLVDEGKPFKVSITAVMRKLFIHIDSVARKWLAGHAGADGAGAPRPSPA